MNKRQKETQQAFLDNEKAVLKRLEEVYKDALGEINSKIELLLARQDADMAHVIYQVQYQKALKDQVSAILEQLHNNEFETLSEYLAQSYEDGFLGTMYDLQGQGIPLVIPIDQEQIVAAIQHETKLSENLYTALGRDTKDLSKKIAGEISRGISGGMMYSEIARNIAAYGRIPKNNAMRIARTEAHRIQTKAAIDAQWKAKGKGADVVKQWDSTLDGRTRDSHRQVDGEIRELDEKFSNGLLYPGDPSGKAAEVVNCRCALLQRAKWALGEEELNTLKERADFFGLDKADSFKDFKKKYLNAAENSHKIGIGKQPSEAYKSLIDGLKQNKVDYREVSMLKAKLADNEIINRLAGGDMTSGSCSSLGFAYIGNRNGMDVLDFRGGNSQEFFSLNSNIKKMLELPNVKGNILKVKKEAADTAKILKGLELDKEYYLAVGKHAAIVRNTKNGVEYLELQSNRENGWFSFNRYGSTIKTLQKRFGCRKTVNKSFGMIWEYPVVLMEVDSFNGNEEFKDILGYINTEAGKQKKGVMGNVK